MLLKISLAFSFLAVFLLLMVPTGKSRAKIWYH